MMTAPDARNAARQWVTDEAAELPGYRGALHHGSIVSLPDSAPLQPTSDVDIVVVIDGSEPGAKVGKFVYRNVLLDVSFLPWDQCQTPEVVLGTSHLAGSFISPDIVSDPTGDLAQIQAVVSRDFAKRDWVIRRCEHAMGKIRANLESIDDAHPFHDQLMAWLFGAGVTTHVLLVAGLRNPTVRKRYVAVRELLEDYGQTSFYEPLLDLLGCAHMTPARVEYHLTTLAAAFDASAEVVRTPLPFSSDITDIARPIAIDGSQELIDQGDHREAMFWIAATSLRCQAILHHDAPPDVRARHEHGHRELLDDLGIASASDVYRRRDEVEAFLPRLWDMTESIIVNNPGLDAH